MDGYNIIFKWPRLKKHMRKGDTKRARELLIDDLESLQDIKGWRIEVVFDGAGKSLVGPMGNGASNRPRVGRGDRKENKSVTNYGVRVVYTGSGVEADSYIEKRCFDAKNVKDGKMTGSFIVATDDAMIRNAAQGAGAVCMSAGRFVDELKAVKGVVSHQVEATLKTLNTAEIRSSNKAKSRRHESGGHVFVNSMGESMLIVDKRKKPQKKNGQSGSHDSTEDLFSGAGWKAKGSQDDALSEMLSKISNNTNASGSGKRKGW